MKSKFKSNQTEDTEFTMSEPKTAQPADNTKPSSTQQKGKTKAAKIAGQAAKGLGTGILIGGLSTAIMGMKSADDNDIPSREDNNDGHASNGNNTAADWVDDNMDVATTPDNDMTFAEAFAAARNEVGPGGAFEWNGNIYGTYTAEEWDNLSPEDKDEFFSHFNWNNIETPEQETDPETEQEADAQTEQETEAETEQEADQGTESNPNGESEVLVGPDTDPEPSSDIEVVVVDTGDVVIEYPEPTPDPGPVIIGEPYPGPDIIEEPDSGSDIFGGPEIIVDTDPDMGDIEVIQGFHDESSDMNVAQITSDGNDVLLIDVNNDSTFDVAVTRIDGSDITVDDLGGFTDGTGQMPDVIDPVDPTI